MSYPGELPVGTVTFLFTDIEGSTQLLKQLGGDGYSEALDEHRQILREAFEAHGGHEIDTQGDSFFVAFRRAKDAVSCAITCQRGLDEHRWPEGAELRVRMGIHTGEPAVGGERYVGLGVNRGARIAAAGHGGQVLVSQATRELLRDDPVADVSLRDLGEHQLKDMDEPERIYQLFAPGLREEFPDLKTTASTPFEGREGELAEAAAEEMARSWRRPGRRVLIGATFAAALVGVTVGVLMTQGGGSQATASITPNAVGVVDPGNGKIVSEVPVGGTPGAVAVGPDSVWVTNVNDNTVSRIDPATNQIVQTIMVGGGPSGVAFGGGAVWVANGLDSTVSRIDPTVNREVQQISVGNGPSGVAYGEGAVWVTNSTDGTVSRIDPDARRPPRIYAAAIGASGVAVGFGRVWIASPPTASLVVLDPGSGRVLKEVGVGGEPSAVAIGADAVWVANRADGTVSRVDPDTATVKGLTSIGRGPESIAAGDESIWVANGIDGTLVRLDPASGDIARIVSLGNPPRGVALGPAGAYVAVQSTGLEHRGGTLRVLGAVGSDVSLDPADAWSAWAIWPLTNDGLVGFRRVGGAEGTQLVPDLAVTLPAPVDGGRTYTFEVRRGVRYSSGQAVQPGDFRRAIERLFQLGVDGAFYYGGIVGASGCTKGRRCDLGRGIVTHQSARTVTFRLTAPDPEFLAKLALPFAFAVPPGTLARLVPGRPIPATGPYRVASLERSAGTLRLVRNPLFRPWSPDARPPGYPDAIVFSFGEHGSNVRAVERGVADVALGRSASGGPLSKEKLERLAVRYPSRLHVNTTLSTNYYFLNTRVAPFDDLRVRRAVNLAFDREALVQMLGPGNAPTCQILPPNIPGYTPTCLYSSRGASRLSAARALVRSAGADGASVTVWIPSGDADSGRYMVSVLESIGLRAKLKAQSDAAHFSSVNDPATRAQTGYYGWIADFPSAAGFVPPQFSCDAGPTNVAGFCDRSIDALMGRAAASQSQDPAAATTVWQQVEREILAQAPIVPTYNQSNVDFVSKRVGNYQYNLQWGALLDQLWVK